MARRLFLNRRPWTWPVRIALGLAASAPLGYLMLRSRSEDLPLLAPNAFFWPASILFGLYFTWAFARRHWRHPKPCAPGERSRKQLVAGTFLMYLMPGILGGMLVGWLHHPTLESINRVFSSGSDLELWGFVTSKTSEAVRVHSPYLGTKEHIELRGAAFLKDKPQVGQLARLVMRRGALRALYVAEFRCEKVQ